MSADVFWSAYVEIHQGNRPNQEDYAKCRDDCHLMVLADGMGGHSDGEKASRVVVEKFLECFQRYFNTIEAHGWDADYVRRVLEESAEYASCALSEAKQEKVNPIGSDAGCTLLAACINPRSHKVHFLSVGDSIILVKHRDRQWVWENEKYLDTHLRLLRLDAEHLKARFGSDSDEYRRAEAKARTDPKRLGLTQAVTGNRSFAPHTWTSKDPFNGGDRFILASDGILPLLGSKEEDLCYDKLDSVLRREKYSVPHVRLSRNDRCRVTRRSAARIVKSVIAEGKPNQDNVSVLLVDFPSPDGTEYISPLPQGGENDVYVDDDNAVRLDRILPRHMPGILLIAFLLVSLGVLIGFFAFKILNSEESAPVNSEAPAQPPTKTREPAPAQPPIKMREPAPAQPPTKTRKSASEQPPTKTRKSPSAQPPAKAQESPSAQPPAKVQEPPSAQPPTKEQEPPPAQPPAKAQESPSAQPPTKAQEPPPMQPQAQAQEPPSMQPQAQAQEPPPAQPPTKTQEPPPAQPPTKTQEPPSAQPPAKAQESPSAQPPAKAQEPPSAQPPAKAQEPPSMQPQAQAQEPPPMQPQAKAQEPPSMQPQAQAQEPPPAQPPTKTQEPPPAQPQAQAQESPSAQPQTQAPTPPSEHASQQSQGLPAMRTRRFAEDERVLTRIETVDSGGTISSALPTYHGRDDGVFDRGLRDNSQGRGEGTDPPRARDNTEHEKKDGQDTQRANEGPANDVKSQQEEKSPDTEGEPPPPQKTNPDSENNNEESGETKTDDTLIAVYVRKLSVKEKRGINEKIVEKLTAKEEKNDTDVEQIITCILNAAQGTSTGDVSSVAKDIIAGIPGENAGRKLEHIAKTINAHLPKSPQKEQRKKNDKAS